MQLHKASVSAHTVYYQWFGYFFGNGGLPQESGFLHIGGASAESVEATFTYSHHTGVGDKTL